MYRFFIIILVFLTIFTSFAFADDFRNEPVALVLAGGGARGAYQVGVWKGLLDLGIDIGAVYGVSVGAINGAMMIMNDYDLLHVLWMRLEKSKVMATNEASERVLSGKFSLKDLHTAIGSFLKNDGLDVSPLEDLLSEYIDESVIRNSGTDFGLVTYSLTDNIKKSLHLADIPEGLLVDYILASANFPLFQRKVIGDEEFIDGGVKQNMPVDMIDSEKFSSAVLVSLNMKTPQDLRDYIQGYSEYNLEIKYISPRLNAGSLLDFEPANSIELMKMGYLDCLSVFGVLKGNDLYIYGSDPIKELYLSLNAAERWEAAQLLEIDKLPRLRYFEYDVCYERIIVPEVLKAADSSIELIEKYAVHQDAEPLQLWSAEQLLDETVEKYLSSSHNRINHDRYLDFMSYLSLKLKYTPKKLSSDDSLYGVYIKSFSEF